MKKAFLTVPKKYQIALWKTKQDKNRKTRNAVFPRLSGIDNAGAIIN